MLTMYCRSNLVIRARDQGISITSSTIFADLHAKLTLFFAGIVADRGRTAVGNATNIASSPCMELLCLLCVSIATRALKALFSRQSELDVGAWVSLRPRRRRGFARPTVRRFGAM